MTILQNIDADFVSAMKQKNELELSTLRLVRSALKNKQIELGNPLEDADVISVLRSLKKQLVDALADFESANRTDLIERQNGQIEIVSRYLPVSMSEEDIENIVRRAIEEMGAEGDAAFGKVMSAAMKEVAGRADGNAVRSIVQRLLSE